jgi:hypothetical protein
MGTLCTSRDANNPTKQPFSLPRCLKSSLPQRFPQRFQVIHRASGIAADQPPRDASGLLCQGRAVTQNPAAARDADGFLTLGGRQKLIPAVKQRQQLTFWIFLDFWMLQYSTRISSINLRNSYRSPVFCPKIARVANTKVASTICPHHPRPRR